MSNPSYPASNANARADLVAGGASLHDISRREAFRFELIRRGWYPVPINSAKAPVVQGWQAITLTPSEVASWSAIPSAVGTGVRLGSAVMIRDERGRQVPRHFVRAGDPIGIDFDLDNPADRTLYVAFLAFLVSLGLVGRKVEVGRPDGGATCRVKIMLRAAEDFPTDTPIAQTIHFAGHLPPREGRAPSSRSVEAYAAGRQFAVAGPNAKSGLPIEIRVDDVVAEILPPTAELPAITSAQWRAILDFIASGFGLGIGRAVTEVRSDVEAIGPFVVDPETGKVADGRESALTRAAYAAVGLVYDSGAVPPRIYENIAAVGTLAAEVAWAVVTRDVDLDRPRDGGNGAGEHWSRADVEERVDRAVRQNAGRFLEERRPRDAFRRPEADHLDWTLSQWTAALVEHFHPVISEAKIDEFREAERAEDMREAVERRAEIDANLLERLAAARPDDGKEVRYVQTRPLVFGFANQDEISILYGAPGDGKSSVVASWGFQCAAGMFVDPTRPDRSAVHAEAIDGDALTAFDPTAAHVMISCEGGSVIDAVREGLANEMSRKRAERFRFEERPIPDWWARAFPDFCRAGDAWRGDVPPSRYLKYYGVPGSPGFLIVDLVAAENLLGTHGVKSYLVEKRTFSPEICKPTDDLIRAASLVAGLTGPTLDPATRRPVLISIDNLMSICVSAEDAASISLLFTSIGRLNAHANAGSLVIHHTTKTGEGYAGSAAIMRFASTVVEVARNPADRSVALFHHVKSRMSPRPYNDYSAAYYIKCRASSGAVYEYPSAIQQSPNIQRFLANSDYGGAYYGMLHVSDKNWRGPTLDALKLFFGTAASKRAAIKTEDLGGLPKLGPVSSPADLPPTPGRSAEPLAPVAYPTTSAAPLQTAAPPPAAFEPQAAFEPPEFHGSVSTIDDRPMCNVAYPIPGNLLMMTRYAVPPPARAVTPEQRAEREARQLAKAAVEARVHRAAIESAMLMPASRAASGIRWQTTARPARPMTPRASAPKERVPVDMTPLDRRVAEHARTMDVVFREVIPTEGAEFARAHAAVGFAAAAHSATAAPPMQLGAIATHPPRRPIAPFMPGWTTPPAHPALPPQVTGIWPKPRFTSFSPVLPSRRSLDDDIPF